MKNGKSDASFGIWWPGTELNRRRQSFQPSYLPYFTTT
jgi:hypothetical protein